MNTSRERTNVVKALFFGIEVELIYAMTYYSLVRINNRSFILDTADLKQAEGRRLADDH